MSKPNTLRISAPFDPRHVSGAGIPGAAMPLREIEPATTQLEPDETPSHTFVATGNIEVPRRSNSIAESFSRPSLRLKTSISLLRGHSRSNSACPASAQSKKKEGDSPMDNTDTSPYQRTTPVQSLRKKPSSSRLWRKVQYDEPPAPALPPKPQKLTHHESRPSNVESNHRHPSAHVTSYGSAAPPPTTNPYKYRSQSLPGYAPIPPPKPEPPVPVRPKRADSGTAIEFDSIPPAERPLGFQEIQAVSSRAERMVLYKNTREYWATADHGLDDWVEQTRRPKQMPSFF
ncbi:unnamed protein product [Periconia digitata]|uniref:Uncharacterized protein n=1 Tax=Periconia digitata TaxID=1303443 RepID=A0A9W4UFP0_9PLEO|nr:unnamed protein product [Periconia digitata]